MDKGSSSTVTYMRWRNSDHNNVGNQAADKDEYFQASIKDKCSVNIDNVASGTFTLDEGLDALGFGSFQWKLLFVTGFSWVADAMEMMILSILGPQLHCDWRLSGYKVALITSVVFAGMGLSSSLWGNLSDKYGRKKGLTICMSWTFFYGMLSALAPNFGWLLALRGLVGVGIGGAHQSVTLYSEFIPSKARGFSIILMAAFWALGVVCEVLLALFIMPTLGWRWLLGLSSVPLGIFLCLCVWLHESPRFDLMSGNQAKVMGTLESIAKHNNKALPRGRIVCNVQNNRGRLQDLFTKEYCKTTLLLWFIWFSFAFNYYGIILLTTEMFQARDTCGGLVVVLGTVDYLGRKKSMALPFFIFSISLLPLYACIGRVSLTVFIFIARAFISGGFQVVFVYTPEVFPTETRAFAVGTCSAMSRVGALLTPFVAQVLLRQSAHLTLSAYCVCSFLASCACLLLPIETSGRSLRESEPKNS